MNVRSNWLDRAVGFLSPQLALRRLRARTAHQLLQRHYEAATVGRRTQHWYRTTTDANAALGPYLGKTRDAARDLVRNNPYAESALATIVDNWIGWGIVAAEANKHEAWKRWSSTTACDADGRNDLIGLQKLTARTVAESGEVLVRRRWRRVEDGLPLPLQLQILEPDFIDTNKELTLVNGTRIVQGVEFDPLGRRAAYWLFRSHPGATGSSTAGAIFGASYRVPAEDVLHIFKPGRPGQVRAPSWFAPVLLKFKDFDELDDAQLMKQKIAACLAIITSDVDGTAPPLGTIDGETPTIDNIEPGAILNVPPGRNVTVVQPPQVSEYGPFAQTQLRGLATGLHIAYEDLTGDYTNLPFSAARMSRLRHWAKVQDWRWRISVLQFLDPVWTWAMQASAIMGIPPIESTEWTAPPLPMIEPDKEGLAIQRNIRNGITTLSEEIRARGYNVTEFLDELEEDFKELDRRRLVLDCDPRKMTQAGQLQQSAAGAASQAPAAAES